MSTNSLGQIQRLRNFGAIRALFAQGESEFVYPFRVVWQTSTHTTQGVEVLFSVPKKFHRRANKRNLLRRRTKEAYRLNRETLGLELESYNLNVALIYSTKTALPYKNIEGSIRKAISLIKKRVDQPVESTTIGENI